MNENGRPPLHFTDLSRSSYLEARGGAHRRPNRSFRRFLECVPMKKKVFFACCLTVLLLFFISLTVTNLYSLHLYLTSFDNDTFMDFFNMLKANIEANRFTRYESQTIYPPLANAIYLLFASLLSFDAQVQLSEAVDKNTMFLQEPLMLFVLYVLITMLFLIITLWYFKKGSSLEKWLFIGVFLASSPMIYLYERANNIILALSLTLLFFCLKDSKYAAGREVALIALAIASGIKIYPAIFGFLLLREGRIRDCIHLLLYGIASMILPFFFYGGVSDLMKYVQNLIEGSGALSIGREGFRLNYQAQIGSLLENSPEFIAPVSNAFICFAIAGSVLSTFFSSSTWRLALLFTCLLMGVPNVSYEYSAIFLVIPLALSLDDKGLWRPLDYVYLVLTISVLMPVSPIWFEGYGLAYYSSMFRTLPVQIAGCAVIALTTLLIVDSLFVSNKYGQINDFIHISAKANIKLPIAVGVVPLLIAIIAGYEAKINSPYYVANYIRYTMNDSFQIWPGDAVSQTFIADGNYVDGVGLRIHEFGYGQLTVRLLDANLNELARLDVPSEQLIPSTVNSFMFKHPVEVNREEAYTVEFLWSGFSYGDYFIAFHSVPDYCVDEESAQMHSGAFGTVYDWDYCLAFVVIQEN